MPEVPDESIALVVTSPPYWMIKDYGAAGQIGYGQSLHAYLEDLHRAWAECRRVVREGGRLCVNVGDQFARARLFGRYRVIPLHAEIVGQCVALGFDYLGAIIWRKKTTLNTSGGAVVMGSFPYPPNGIVEIDFEYILLFKKPGKARSVARTAKQKAPRSAPRSGRAGSPGTGTWAARGKPATRRHSPRRYRGGSSGCSVSRGIRYSIPSWEQGRLPRWPWRWGAAR